MTEPRPLPYAWDDVKARLQTSLPDVAEKLGLRFKEPTRAARWFPLNPTRTDKRPGSFCVWSATGNWAEFAGLKASGDVFDLIAYVEGLQGKMDAYWRALELLGLGRGNVRTKAEDVRARERAAKDAAARAAKDQAAAEAKARRLFGLWLGLPPIEGTPAERYLREVRGLPLERLAHEPGALRWCEAAEWFDPDTGEVFEWRNVMVSAMTAGKTVTGLHRTWLTPDGSGPDPRRKAQGKHKTMIGQVAGAAIRISPGPSGLSPTRATAKGRTDPLIVAEGIEDALTLAIARPDCRVWAAGSLSLMGLLEWPECASAVVLAADNDWDKPAAVQAFSSVEAVWRSSAAGRAVHIARSRAGKDFNDMARS